MSLQQQEWLSGTYATLAADISPFGWVDTCRTPPTTHEGKEFASVRGGPTVQRVAVHGMAMRAWSSVGMGTLAAPLAGMLGIIWSMQPCLSVAAGRDGAPGYSGGHHMCGSMSAPHGWLWKGVVELETAGSPLLQYDRADRCFVTSTKRAPIYPRGGTWCRATGPNPQVVAHQELVSYYQRHPPAHPEDVFTILRIDIEPIQTAESAQSPIYEQPLELPEVQYVPIKIPDIEPPPAPPAPTNAPVEVPMATFTQADIDQRIAVALAAYQSQQSTANRPLRLDIPAPEPFSGKAEDLRRFIQCILSYFVTTNNTRLSDEAKIAFTVALMRKDLGKTWVDAYYEKSAGGVQTSLPL
ncbi:predicted protein [Postia placenta Mad-698-R]|nr:predicted protein [Postia placenta Mad-698-R]